MTNQSHFDVALSVNEEAHNKIMAAIITATEGNKPGGVVAQPYIDGEGVLRLKGAALQRHAAEAVYSAIHTQEDNNEQ